jgi:hypothetical protein
MEVPLSHTVLAGTTLLTKLVKNLVKLSKSKSHLELNLIFCALELSIKI